MPIGPKRLPFFEHIAELRKRLIIVVSVVLVTTLVLYTWAWDAFEFVLKPVLPYLTHAGVDQFKVGGPFEGFTFRFKIAMYAAIVFDQPDHHLAGHGVLPAGAQAKGEALRDTRRS